MPVAHEADEAELHRLARRLGGKPGEILEIDAVRYDRDAPARYARRGHMAGQYLGDRQDDVRAAPDETLRGMASRFSRSPLKRTRSSASGALTSSSSGTPRRQAVQLPATWKRLARS